MSLRSVEYKVEIHDKSYDILTLKDYCVSLIDKTRLLEKEVRDLQEMLSQSMPNSDDKSVEQRICEKQLEYLQLESQTRALTLEETKRLDLIIKNKLLANNKPTEIINNQFKDINIQDLIKIASSNE